MSKWIIGLIVIGALGLAHTVNWLVSKGVIWIMKELFNINWYSKFWVIYVFILILGLIFKQASSSK